jgi:hypothetical protein
MQILRIVSVQVIDSTNISVKFTEDLTPNLVTSNVSIISETPNVPDSQAQIIKVSQDTLNIICQPLTPLAAYYVTFQSVQSHIFESVNGDAQISADGVSNRYLINGPLGPDNPVQNYLTSYFNDNIYNLGDSNTVVSKYIQSLSVALARALYDIRQVKNENYLSFTVTDERKIRGAGPFDRLNEEAAYEISRVGLGPSTASAQQTFPFTDFPSYPVTLQKQTALETLHPNSLDLTGDFNINSLTLNLSNAPVTRLTSVVFTFNDASTFTYSISTLGYQILDSRYDQDFGFTYQQLANNQLRLSDKILSDPTFALDNILKVDVQYEYKNLGIVVDPTSVTVTTVLESIRETLPPIINIFSLQYAPIVTSSGAVSTSGGVTFLDPNSNIPGAVHPAFVVEIPFRLSALPFAPGQYAIDYTLGQVYVYGNDLTNNGTGPFPPLATYFYQLTYKNDLDYTYDPDTSDLVALPPGNLVTNTGNINFNYEQVLIPGIDYNSDLHIEVLEERIQNRLLALNVIQAVNSPITNVFRIFNETSGEIYTLDRWNDNKIYFRYNNPPNVVSQTGERASFNTITNELLFVNTTLTTSGGLKVFKIFLNNNTLASSTEDSLASFFNTSLVFTNGNVFVVERWFTRELAEASNVNRLVNVGDYMVDYANGVVYVAVSNTQGLSIGTATYKNDSVSPQFPHVISVEDIYYRISALNPKNKSFAFTSFGDGTIVPTSLDPSDELYLNSAVGAPYQILNGAVGIFSPSFVAGVTNQVKFVRSVYEYSDILHSTAPLNFAFSTTSSGFNITVNPISKEVFTNIQTDGSNLFLDVNENIPFLSSNITYTFNLVRVSDNAVLGASSIVAGNPVKLILNATNTPVVGQLVKIDYTFTINNLSRVVIDYNKGDYFVDYTYIADEIIISYEYGDNFLDFRTSQTVPENTQYFVTYKAGALRDALLKNFGTLVNVPQLSNFDIDFPRERYRDALVAALSSFIQGPTVNAIKNIGKTISHIEPEVIESVFQNWSLGSSILNPEPLVTTGTIELLPGKFGDGTLVSEPNQTITFPANSNLRLEEGTFESWIVPQWNGLDNDADLTFNITQDGYQINPRNVFIGASEYHPTIVNGTFTLDKNSNVLGTPNTNKDGIFIYYNKDISGNFNRWYIRVIDGYVSPCSSAFQFKITSTGSFYDSKSLVLPKPSNLSITTGVNTLSFKIGADGYADEGVTFVSDLDHYLLDFGEAKTKNRLSIYKDVSGYMNFRAYDRDKTSYSVSADVSSWNTNMPHHVAASWKLNTANGRDELHLFLDGFEVPNIIRYGQKLQPYLHEKFRTVDPEEIAGSVTRDIVAGTDLYTALGSPLVTSTINFSAYNIFNGDTIFIDEIGFNPAGYQIININGQNLTLNAPMPSTLTNARFSVNRTAFTVSSDIDVAPNIEVTTIHAFISGNDLSGTSCTNLVQSLSLNFTTLGVQPGYSIKIDSITSPVVFAILAVSGNTLTINGPLPSNVSSGVFQIYSNTENEIPGVRALRPAYSISKDANFNNILTVSNDVFAGDIILVRTLGFNHRRIKKQYYVWSDGYENVLMTSLPPPISLDEAHITKVILSPYAVFSDGYFPADDVADTSSGLFDSGGIKDGYDGYFVPLYQTTNTVIGRTLTVNIAGTAANITFPATVTINGCTAGNVLVNETITFNSFGSLDSTNRYIYINFIHVSASPTSSKKSLTIGVKEKYPMTVSEGGELVPVVRFSYPIAVGYNLSSTGPNTVTDPYNQFSGLDINNYLYIQSGPAAGYYVISGLSADRHSITLKTSIPAFTNSSYQVLNVSDYRSGLQNGFFTFEDGYNLPGVPYFLSEGFYELDYSTYTSIRISPLHEHAYLGSDFTGTHQLNGIIDQVKIYSVMLTDTRVGETIPANQNSITKDFNSLKPLKSDSTTLMLLSMDSFPLTNSANSYIIPPFDKQHFQSSIVVNENFGQSIVITRDPIIVPNNGILDTRKQGTVEFWVNPFFDSANDPHQRFYFDAFGAIIEDAVSVNNTAVKISTPASQILSVTLKSGDPRIDYFAGGKLEIDTQRAIQEEGVSMTNSSVVTGQPILQIITVKIIGDLTGTDYFANGTVGTDQKTIYLGKTLPASNLPLLITYQTTANNNDTLDTQVIRLNRKLPNQNTHVVVKYIPKGLQGDRISIWKDTFGYVNFGVSASGTDFLVRAPTRWARNTWHRVKASYKFNGGVGADELRLFLDGYEWTNVLFGTGLVFGQFPIVMGSSMPGDGYNVVGNINFKDPINELFIGSDYTGANPLFALIDNFRISDLSRPLYAPYGESLDVNYSSNLSTVIPVTVDLFTTYLLDFNSLLTLNNNFSILNNRKTGSFDFSVNIIDSFGIVNSNIKSQEALEELINVLKPANSRVFIQYIR